jgi:hypothetical protein
MSDHSAICEAIGSRTLLEFDYDEHHRVVAPYCHGVTRKNIEVLRAIQVGGSSRTDGRGLGKLWHAKKMQNPRSSHESLIPSDPKYNPDDRVMLRIHCRV